MTEYILTGFMKKMQCNALNIKTVTKQVWFYFILGIYAARIRGHHHESSDSFKYPKHSYLNQAAHKKIACEGGEKRRQEIHLLFAG